ncbi:MAG: hypothetical protein ABR609_14120, partial [Acidimicrobiia bacterium]
MTAQQAYASATGHAGSDRLVVHTLAPGVVFWRRKDGTIPVFAPWSILALFATCGDRPVRGTRE